MIYILVEIKILFKRKAWKTVILNKFFLKGGGGGGQKHFEIH